MAATEATFTGKGGLSIFYRAWQPEGTPRGVVVICHGVNSHGGQYIWAAERLVESGFAVFALDLRGRGRSEGRRFFVTDAADYASDVAGTIAIAKAAYPGLKLFLLGHSAGGVTSTIYTLDHQAEIDGFICESFAYQVPAPAFALAIIKFLGGIFPKLPVLKLKNKDFSRDPAWVAALDADPYTQNETQPAATVRALLIAGERMKVEFPTITIPLLIMHGTQDKATVPAGSIFFHKTAGSADKTLKLYEGHYHDLLADLGKESVMGDITAWIEARL
ncbi:MAG: alpha/beta fold hydrolase [Sphingomonadales bacterium]|nr:MAG: alpha/beta fold hydrolase [Sphingomonadales bacterium]